MLPGGPLPLPLAGAGPHSQGWRPQVTLLSPCNLHTHWVDSAWAVPPPPPAVTFPPGPVFIPKAPLRATCCSGLAFLGAQQDHSHRNLCTASLTPGLLHSNPLILPQGPLCSLALSPPPNTTVTQVHCQRQRDPPWGTCSQGSQEDTWGHHAAENSQQMSRHLN